MIRSASHDSIREFQLMWQEQPEYKDVVYVLLDGILTQLTQDSLKKSKIKTLACLKNFFQRKKFVEYDGNPVSLKHITETHVALFGGKSITNPTQVKIESIKTSKANPVILVPKYFKLGKIYSPLYFQWRNWVKFEEWIEKVNFEKYLDYMD